MYYDSTICDNINLNVTHGFWEHFGSATDANIAVSIVAKEQVRWNSALVNARTQQVNTVSPQSPEDQILQKHHSQIFLS